MRLADVGTDHAYVPVYLLQKGVVQSALAMDVGRGPLERATETIRKYHLEDKIKTRLSDGLSKLSPGEVDSVVIAGMGGSLMRRLLENSPEVAGQLKELILQPQSEIFLVREYLRISGWRIVEEEMLVDAGKYYTLMKALPITDSEKSEKLPDKDYRLEDVYGPVLLREKHPVLRSYLTWERGIFAAIEKQLPEDGGEAVEKRRLELREKIALNEEAQRMLQA